MAKRLHRTGPVLALMLVAGPACAQTVMLFGAQTCENWLAEPATDGLGRYWILGAWSGLNYGGLLRKDRTDTGHTLTAADVVALVHTVCEQTPAMPVSEAAARAWAQSKANGR